MEEKGFKGMLLCLFVNILKFALDPPIHQFTVIFVLIVGGLKRYFVLPVGAVHLVFVGFRGSYAHLDVPQFVRFNRFRHDDPPSFC